MRPLLAVALALSLGPAASATAATVSSDGSTIRYSADGADSHEALVEDTPDVVRVLQGRGSQLQAGAGCSLESTRPGTSAEVVCPRAGIVRVVAEFGGGDDSLSVG